MIICAFNLRFITQTSYLRLYHFFQINSFLMSFYSFIKFLRYYCSSFIPARIFSLIELRLLHNLVIFMGRTGVMLVLFYIQQIFFSHFVPCQQMVLPCIFGAIHHLQSSILLYTILLWIRARKFCNLWIWIAYLRPLRTQMGSNFRFYALYTVFI